MRDVTEKCADEDGEQQNRLFISFHWLVIAIGARDGSTPLQWWPLGRSLTRLLGIDREPQPLASPCLESLRRMASLARQYGWDLPATEIGAFFAAGWTQAHLEQVIESVQIQGSHPRPGVSDAALRLTKQPDHEPSLNRAQEPIHIARTDIRRAAAQEIEMLALV